MRGSKYISRRDFLKLSSLIPLSILARPILDSRLPSAVGDNKHNVIILVFDAWSASNLALYGYQRQTMPNLERFAERALVFHNHLSAGTFTVPGAAALLTGLYPWSHRAFQLGGFITDKHKNHQIFHAVKRTHRTLGFTQNKYADQFLSQDGEDLDTHLQPGSFHAQRRFLYSLPIFRNDEKVAFHTFDDNIFQEEDGYDSSLFLGPLFRSEILRTRKHLKTEYGKLYPWEIPDAAGEMFLYSDVVDGAIKTLKKVQEPSFLYLHFWPPHAPYSPKARFYKAFSTGWRPKAKPIHPAAVSKYTPARINWARELYDEVLLSWDAEIARLFDYLEESGLLDNSYVFVTSDHGECFERGEVGHWSKFMFDPLLHVPLIVSRPGQSTREDVYASTSHVDILPTLAHLTGNPAPDWGEGKLLPGLGGKIDPSRGVFAMDAKQSFALRPLKNRISLSITKYPYRLSYYNYPWYRAYEFYDLDTDPDELNDLYPSQPAIALRFQEELMDKLADANRPYESE